MTLQLPAHLANRQAHNIAEKAAIGLGATLPPHISIQGNTFTLIDAGGNEAPIGPVLDIVVADSSEQPAKRFYPPDKPWTKDSKDPPTCQSANGIVPDASSPIKQARTCAECKWNERGSAISKMSGVAIKACRDEKWLAVLLPQYPAMLFQLVITPGSFKNWQAFTKNFGNGVDISDVITRATFQSGDNGVMVFEILGYAQNNPQYISNDILQVLERAWTEKATDILVGRSDQPLALAAPQAAVPVQEQQPPANFIAAPSAGFQPSTATPQFQTSAGPAAPVVEQPRRRRRTAAEMAAANGQPPTQPAWQQPVPFMPQGQPAPAQPMAPFVPAQQAPPAPQGNGAQFGIAAGAAPNADLTKMLEGVFGKK